MLRIVSRVLLEKARISKAYASEKDEPHMNLFHLGSMTWACVQLISRLDVV